jgi:hypothetical protein
MSGQRRLFREGNTASLRPASKLNFGRDRNGAADGACDRRHLEVPGYPIAVSSWAIAIARRARTASARERYK